ncbi:Na(+)/H(+) antiporter subunit D [Fontimonas sp. SYSU GA230001]|uniref:Na(+)/H(+) antiporter subunit D n=1 Tax=Fontimonas sp. SYSU GA230001 TaxID=3142450 RepID=UPI0032B3936B
MLEALLNPALLLIAGGLLLPLLHEIPRKLFMLALPAASLALLCWLPAGDAGEIEFFGIAMETLRIDRLSFVFGVIFHIAAWLAVIYALHLKDTLQHVAAMVYAGAAIGAVLAGDLVTLMLYWELTALSSVFLIWARRTERAYRVGMRYLIIQVGSGVLLIAGIAVRYVATGSVDFERMDLAEPGAPLIFLAFGIKCAFPLLHNWLQDAYPEATVTGTVVLSAFTTKLAVYALARGFAGTEMLIWIGAAMTLFPIFFAVIENDLRRVLAYSLNNQLGFMVCGIGVGTELAINGAAAHAFAHILYKALLFMAMGAVLFRVGTIKASELGGLYKSMPWTAAFCIIGSLSISSFPLLSGFVTKSMILTAVAEEHRWIVWLMLLFASAGVLDHSGIKIPFFSFFAHDSGKRCAEAPANMLVAMALAAALCIGIGLYPAPLYALLPFDLDYDAYSVTHVITQLQLLLFAAAGFAVLYRRGWYPPEIPSLNLDSDWIYRRFAPAVWDGFLRALAGGRDRALQPVLRLAWRGAARLSLALRPNGRVADAWPTGTMVLWTTLLLGLFLLAGLRP